MGAPSCPMFSQKLQYLLDKDQPLTDTLHNQAVEPIGCTRGACKGSILQPIPHRKPGSVRPKHEVLSQAKDFYKEYYASIKRLDSDEHQKRIAEVVQSIEKTGTYSHTSSELNFGSKTAWRNAPRCIGRIQWTRLQTFDARKVTTARGMFDAICTHIKYASNDGMLRSAITVFPPRTDGQHDFRLWNAQLISYAGYRQPDGSIKGDKIRLEFTELCEKLGWRGKGGDFDVLPLVLQANGQDPEWFEVPQELILEVQLTHPKFPWFKDLGLKWYALPAVANMMFDCGGLEYTAAPFNGWYMSTEIGSRDLCDPSRYDLSMKIASKMGLNTNQVISLWKDQAMVACNVAVLHSFQVARVTIMDHHSAAESFIQHHESELKTRGGCPSDWVWIVPPMSGSLSQVFHLEMLNYKLKPSYEYQLDPWTFYKFKKDELNGRNGTSKRRKITFKDVAKAVMLSNKLMRTALAKRVKCTILYATETGRSERYAKTLCDIFKNAFNASVHCMSDYNPQKLEHENLVFIVTSTFGNGDPPENGTDFSKKLYEMVPKHMQKGTVKTAKHMAVQERTDSMRSLNTQEGHKAHRVPNGRVRPDSARSMVSSVDLGPLSNVRYSVFALGSKAYPNFCAFGHYMHRLLHDLDAEVLYDLAEGDELCGQDQSFNEWSQAVFKTACETFCMGEDVKTQGKNIAVLDRSWAPGKVRLSLVQDGQLQDLCEDLSKLHHRKVVPTKMVRRENLQSASSERETILVEVDIKDHAQDLPYQPGDHLAAFPINSQDQVDAVMRRLSKAPPRDKLLRMEWMQESQTGSGAAKTWIPDQRLPEVVTLDRALKHYLDISSCPAQSLLEQFALTARKDNDRNALLHLATSAHAYEKFKFENAPSVADVLEKFKSVTVSAALLLSQLPILQQRYYSISSSPAVCPGQVHMTVAVVKYQTHAGKTRHGLCSSWLNNLKPGEMIPAATRSAPLFHMPKSPSTPLIMVGPGSGIAPFRSFWQQRTLEKKNKASGSFGPMTLYFGCRESSKDLVYKRELDEAKASGVMDVDVALSREPGKPKTYVQNLLQQNSADVASTILKQSGHFYVCGDVTMAQNVGETLEGILTEHSDMDNAQAAEYVLQMKEENRYHEDIFGVTLKTSAVLERVLGETGKTKDADAPSSKLCIIL